MIPKKSLVVLSFVALGVAVLSGALGAPKIALYVVDGIIVLAVLFDALLIRGRRLDVERNVGAILSVGRANAVTLSLRNKSRRTLRGTVSDDPVSDAITEGLPAAFVLPPHGVATVRYEVTPTRRGPRDFADVVVRYVSPLGLLARQEKTEIPSRAD